MTVTVERGTHPSSDGQGSRPRIAVIAYACAPGRGSEPGAGWGISRALAEVGSVTAIVADEFLPTLTAWGAEHPDVDLTFVGLPEGRFTARLGALHRIPRFVQYLLWLRRAAAVLQRLHADEPFDVAVHASYGVYWLPSPVVDLGIPSVWGPVGGAVATPVPLWPSLGFVGALGELLDMTAVRLLALLPATRRTWRMATTVVVNNIETLEALSAEARSNARIINNAPFVEVDPRPRGDPGPYAIFPSALDPRKGPRLALEAFSRSRSDLRLIFAADGPERPALQRMARRLGIEDRVEFRGWIPRDEMWDLLAGASVAMYTGLREEGGLALVEGMLHGTPLVVVGHGGARAVAEDATDPARVRIVPPGSSKATARRIADAIDAIVRDRPAGVGPTFDRSAHCERFRDAVLEACGVSVHAPSRSTVAPDPDPLTGAS